jgi:hypothetical protein
MEIQGGSLLPPFLQFLLHPFTADAMNVFLMKNILIC